MDLKTIEGILLERIGLDANTLGPQAIKVATQTRMSALGLVRVGDYAARLLAEESEQQSLVEEVVVSESWFFRERPAYQLLASRLAAVAASGTTLRILCIPCATGEEPYSAVMTLLEAGVADRRIEVTGVDVSDRALERARSGRYSRISFRGDFAQYRHYFASVGSDFVVEPAVRSRVNLLRGNLLEPALLADQTFHAIFCRNLLIYLDRASRVTAVRQLRRWLRPGALLIVGHSEAQEVLSQGFVRTGDHRSFAFVAPQESTTSPKVVRAVKPSEGATVGRSPRAGSASAPMASSSAGPGAARPLEPPPLAKLSAATGQFVPAAALTVDARALADRGALHEAMQLCKRALQATPDCAETHSLMGVISRALGDVHGARRCFEHALRLQGQHHEALVHMALLAESLGDHQSARTYRERASNAREL